MQETIDNLTRRNFIKGVIAAGAAVSGNLCRCQDCDKILTALMRGAELQRGA
jgi:aerobic-type carbon monoxide dehydrogenase small subunit (CoxS/CutS family)